MAFFLAALVLLVGCAKQAENPLSAMPAIDNTETPERAVVEEPSQEPAQKPTEEIIAEPIKQEPEAAKTEEVEIKGFAFDPQSITVKKGTTVTWTQRDSVRHTVTSDDNLFDSGLLSKDQSWNYTFDDIGTFSYYCTPHPYMKGEVVVE